MQFLIHIRFCCDCFDACKFYVIIHCFCDLQLPFLHAFMFWFLTMESGRNPGSIVVGILVVKKAKVSGVSRDITYAYLIDHLYDLLRFDRSKYDLVLKVAYELRGRIIAPTVISNDEYLSFFLDEIYISIQYRTLLCVLVVERIVQAG